MKRQHAHRLTAADRGEFGLTVKQAVATFLVGSVVVLLLAVFLIQGS